MPDSDATQESSDSGFTLVELLIYMTLAVVVLTLVGGMLISTLTAEKSIVSRSEATVSGQAVAQSVRSGVRNAVAYQLTSTGEQLISEGDQLLVVETLGTQTELAPICLAWYYAKDGRVFYQRSEAAVPVTRPGEDFAGWLLLATGVRSAKGVFIDKSNPSGKIRIDLSLSLAASDGSNPVLIESTTISRENSTEMMQCSS